MPKPKDAESYDVAGTRYRQHEDPIAVLGQALADYATPNPSRGYTWRINGNLITLYCHCHERGLGDPGRRAAQVDAMSKGMDKFVAGLKKQHREISGKTLSMKEKKSARGYDLQKVSMNDRWDIVYRRTYEVGDLIRNPEED
jgi:hypothetical protein